MRPPAVPLAPDIGFVCNDGVLRHRMRGLAAAVKTRMAVHLTGETGTGKELMARYVHALSGRGGDFIAVNCGAIPESLFITELFGHERGAYTNARNDGAPGLACLANKGTLFLDEVADIPFPAQTALLRFLDSMEVRPVGGGKARRVDVQIVSATNRDLQQAVADRQFRSDLLYRLNAFTVLLPPLRERTDFSEVVHHLLARHAPGVVITDQAVERLKRRHWPGNIRELEAALRRAAVMAETAIVDESVVDPGHAESGDVCLQCAGRPLSRAKCRQIRQTYAANVSVAATARLLGLSRTTVYKHLPAAEEAAVRE